MPKITEGRLALGSLFLFAFWLFVVLPFLYSVPLGEHRASPTKCSPATIQSLEFWDRAACDPVAYFTGWLVAFTGVLAFSTIGLWVATGSAARNQTRDTRILQRAYIAVDGGGIFPLDTKSIAHVGVKNVGNLPAREVSWFISYAVDPDGRRSYFPIDETHFYGRNVVPPGTEMKRSQNCTLDPRDIMAFESGASSFYVWGEVRYLDGFGQKRFTRFCHRYNRTGLVQHLTNFAGSTAQTVVSQEVTAESMRYHQFGNDAD